MRLEASNRIHVIHQTEQAGLHALPSEPVSQPHVTGCDSMPSNSTSTHTSANSTACGLTCIAAVEGVLGGWGKRWIWNDFFQGQTPIDDVDRQLSFPHEGWRLYAEWKAGLSEPRQAIWPPAYSCHSDNRSD